MRSLFQLSLALAMATAAAHAQFPGLTLPASGNNQMATVTQAIGPVQVSIRYSGPAVHGPDGKDRRGQIWGQLVPYGMANLGFGTAKESPWRAGSNENTIFTVSHDVIVQGKPLAAGSYGLSMIPGQDEWTIIFSKNSSAWGSFFYDPSQDALRVTTKPHKNDYREWLTYEFTVRKPTEATVELQWEDLAIPMTIQVENANDIYIALLRDELTSSSGFSYQAFSAAAQFCVQANTHLEQGLEWASAAIDRPFIGQKNFETYAVKGLVLAKMGKDAEADKAMWDSVRLPGTTAIQVDELGQVLLNEKRNEKAMEVFKFNVEHNGDVWPVHEGLARGYSATGDIKQALEQAQKALPQAPDDANRKAVEKMIKTLSEGKPIGQ